MSEKSIGGAEYFLTFTDDKTRYSWVYPLKTVFDCFLEWKALVETSSGRVLKALRSDNGGEYTSKRFENYLRSHGIRHEFTIPKTPEQNGVVERLNRTLVESSRSMLLDAKLSHKFWAEAISTAAYLKNRCPTTTIKGMTPYEAWFGKKPKVEHLGFFGCDAYAHIPKDERGKLDSKARKCILLGYGRDRKEYRLYDPVQQKILHRRDVRFNEAEKTEAVTGDSAGVEADRHLVVDFSDPDVGTPNSTVEPILRRSEKKRKRSTGLLWTESYTHLSRIHCEPISIEEATSCPDSLEWMQAMEAEMKSLKANDVWELVDLPAGKKAVGSKWVYKVKTGADGSIERHKARLVAQGFTQIYGADYDETFCPCSTTRVTSCSNSTLNPMWLETTPTTAFLNGILEEEVYMKQPRGFVTEGEEHLVCKLKKSTVFTRLQARATNSFPKILTLPLFEVGVNSRQAFIN